MLYFLAKHIGRIWPFLGFYIGCRANVFEIIDLPLSYGFHYFAPFYLCRTNGPKIIELMFSCSFHYLAAFNICRAN